MYAATRRRILSSANPYYFSGTAFTGLGSPHTPHKYIWPLAHMVDALTTEPTAQGGWAGPERMALCALLVLAETQEALGACYELVCRTWCLFPLP